MTLLFTMCRMDTCSTETQLLRLAASSYAAAAPTHTDALLPRNDASSAMKSTMTMSESPTA